MDFDCSKLFWVHGNIRQSYGRTCININIICFYKSFPVIAKADIYADDTNRDETEGFRSVLDNIYIHPIYNTLNNDYDFALAKLNKPLTWSNKIKSIDLPNVGDKLKVGDHCWAIGWGNKSNNF